MKIAVIGAGSWGTALASMLGEKYDQVVLWARKQELAEQINNTRANTCYLPNIVIPSSVLVTHDLIKAITNAHVIVIVTPSLAVREVTKRIAPHISAETIIVSAAKGLELGSLKRMSQVIIEEVAGVTDQVAILSGPNHAEEIGLKHPSASVVAANSITTAQFIQDMLMTPYFRIYINPDMIGVELGGALKNIIALGAGIAQGLGYGDNTKAALITRGLAEIARLGTALGANPLTFTGLSGVGDLTVTCSSPHSRNCRAGILLGRGKTKEEIQSQTSMVVEGISSTAAAYALALAHNVTMPITEEIYRVLYQEKSPLAAVSDLMMRGKTFEVEEDLLTL